MTVQFAPSSILAANVATIPQRSPLRYPGGKTWLIPHVRAWLQADAPWWGGNTPDAMLVEPFAGGGIVSLTAVMEGLCSQAVMVDWDRDVSAFWRVALEHTDDLIARVLAFEPTRENIEELPADTLIDYGFRTLVLNRTRRGGVLAPGAALTRNGENGHGVASRWYPDTLVCRLQEIAEHAERLLFLEGNGVRLMEIFLEPDCEARFFIDPPYTATGGKQAGSRLYVHNAVDHARIFRALAESGADFLMTYDCSDEIVGLVQEHGFHGVLVEMKNTHHARIPELVITRNRLFT